MTRQAPIDRLFIWLFKEEWRLHARLFGGPRFAFVPIVILVGSAISYRLLGLAAVTPDGIVAGLHVLALLLGLQVGAVALVGRDMIENLLGETTVLLSTVRTLPVAGRRLLAIFVIKDVCYYALLYITPVVGGLLAVLGMGITIGTIFLAWVTVTTTFTLGVAASTALVGIATRHRFLPPAIVAAIAAIVYVWPTVLDRFTPYAIYTDLSILGAVTSLLLIGAAAGIGYYLFDLRPESTTRTTTNQYHWLRHHVPGRTPWLVAKAILDVARSSGGLGKVVVSLTLVVIVVGAVLEGVTRAVGLRPAAGPAFSALLAIASFTTYNWLTTVDDADLRRGLPIQLQSVFWSVLIAHLILALPTATVLLLAAAWWFGPTAVIPGVLALPGLMVYVVGITAYTTGLHPGERLFDAGRFTAFGVAAAIVAVPVFIVAFAIPSIDLPLAWLVTAGSFVAGIVGLVLIYWSGHRWGTASRTADTR